MKNRVTAKNSYNLDGSRDMGSLLLDGVISCIAEYFSLELSKKTEQGD